MTTFGNGFVDRELQVRVRLVVLKFDVVARLVLFDEARFEDQRLDFVVGDDELEIRDLSDERVGFTIERPGAEVGTDTAARFFALPT
jgi:hypothetical protein